MHTYTDQTVKISLNMRLTKWTKCYDLFHHFKTKVYITILLLHLKFYINHLAGETVLKKENHNQVHSTLAFVVVHYLHLCHWYTVTLAQKVNKWFWLRLLTFCAKVTICFATFTQCLHKSYTAMHLYMFQATPSYSIYFAPLK